MHPGRNPDLSAGNLAFLARQTAGQCHELMNVFNVINELTGLLSDTLSALDAGKPMDSERLQALPKRIADQLGRGEGLVRLISQFVHSADTEWAVVDLAEALTRAVELVQRRARLCRSEVRLSVHSGSCALETNPLGLLHAIIAALELVLEPLGREPAMGGTLVLSAMPTDAGPEISVTHLDGELLGPLAATGLENLRAILGSLDATLVLRHPPEALVDGPGELVPTGVVLRFPSNLALDTDRGGLQKPCIGETHYGSGSRDACRR